jgi:type II secretion system protein L
MSRKILGLDIRADIVCAVLVKSSLRETRIAASMAVPVAGDGPGSGGLRAALDTIAATFNLAGTDCAVAIPAALFSCRTLFVPFANVKKIRMVLPFELEPALAHQAEDLTLDFTVVAGTQAKEQTEVLVAALEKAKLAPFVADLIAAGLEPERVTMSGLAAAVWIGRTTDPGAATLCLDIGATSGALIAVTGADLRLVRSFPLSPDPAARTRVLRSTLRTTIGALEELGVPHQAPVPLFVTGAGSKGMALESLGAGMPVALQAADLARGIGARPETGELDDWEPALMDGALALALTEIEGIECLNFHRSQFPGRKILSRYREQLTRTGLLAAAVLLLMFGSVLVQSHLYQSRLATLDRQMVEIFRQTFPEVKKVADPFQQMQISLQELRKASPNAGEAAAAVRSIDVLRHISESIPEEIAVVFERMVIGADSVLISGTTAAFNAVDEIKGRLERIAGFKKVTISSANTDRSGKEINFQIKVDL